MKKILLNVALIASMAVSAYAQGNAPEMSITTDWGYVVENGKANPVPDFEGGWGGNATPENKYCTRFGVGKDGKFLVQNHSNNTISAVTATGVEVYKQLNPITPGVKWNGTAISTDDAGNVIFNYCFTAGFGAAETAQGKSVKYWGVLDKNKNITDVNVPDADYNALGITEKGRLDIISHIVGDVTSAKGGIGYACLQGFDKVVMFHFKGDGTKVTSVSVKACSRKIEVLPKSGVNGDTQLIMASPKYTKLDQILAEENPEDQFVLPLGVLNPNGADNGVVPPVIAGIVATFNDGDFEQLMGYGNRGYLLSSVFELQGKKYMVRNYMDEQSDLYKNSLDGETPIYSSWGNVMTYGVFDMTTGQCVASWMGSGYRNGFGMGYINVEPIDANSVHIYTYASVGGAYNTDINNEPSGTKNGIYCAVTTLKVKGNDPVPPTPGEIAGSGTETDPYLIASKEDLCNAYTKVEPNKVVYFKQTADIDMAGVTEYHALNGSAGGFPVAEGSEEYAYNSGFVYDGANHIISNFQPVDRAAIVENIPNSYYCSSLFGVIEGKVMNLGVVNAKIALTDNLGGGVLGAYFGHAQAPEGAKTSVIENVFVQGEVSNAKASSYAGGFIGTNSTVPCEITNCYALVDVVSTDASAYVGVIEARLRGKDNVVINNVYGAGTAEFAEGANKDKVGLLFSSDKDTGISLGGANLIGFGEGNWAGEGLMEESKLKAEMFAAKDAAGIAKVQGWAAFSNKVMWNEYPTLNWNSGVGNIFADEVDENAPVEYYNLSGVRVANPTPGIYVKKQGTKVTKVIVR